MLPGAVTPRDANGSGWRGVKDIRDKKDCASHELPTHLGFFVVARLKEWNSHFFLAEDTPYLFDGVLRRVFRVSARDPQFWIFLQNRFGLLRTDKAAQGAAAFLESTTWQIGDKCEASRFARFFPTENVLYLSRYNGEAWRLDGKSPPTVVPNGTGGVFFLDDEGISPCEAEPGPHHLLFPTILNDLNYVKKTQGGLSADEQRDLIVAWFHALAFRDLFLSKPLLLVEGEKGSGKTVALQRMQYLFTGRLAPLLIGQNDEADFGVQLLRSSPFGHLDNMDTEIKWLRDAICGYATGGVWRKRKKYTDTDSIDIRPNTFVAITSRNPTTFRRDDVADRCLIVRLNRRLDVSAPDHMMERVAKERPRLLGEWIYNLNNILARLPQISSTGYHHRLADFARFLKASQTALGLSEPDSILDKAQAERDVLMTEDDPLVDVLDRWLDNTENVGREVAMADLYGELVVLAGNMGIPNFSSSARGLAQHLRHARIPLARHFQIETREGSKHTTMYQFRRNDS